MRPCPLLCPYTHSEPFLTLTPACRDGQDSGTTPWCGYSRGGDGWEARDHLQDSGAHYG